MNVGSHFAPLFNAIGRYRPRDQIEHENYPLRENVVVAGVQCGLARMARPHH